MCSLATLHTVVHAMLRQSLVAAADGIPIVVRLLNAKDFEPGPFNLGRFGPVIATIAVLWVGFITVRALSLDSYHSCRVTPHFCCLPEICMSSFDAYQL